MKLLKFIFVIVLSLVVSCEQALINVNDTTFKVELDVITPTVGYGDSFRAKLFSSHEEFTVQQVECAYPLYAGRQEIVKYSTYKCSDTGIEITSPELTPTSDEDVRIYIVLKSNSSGEEVVINESFIALKEDILIPESITPYESSVLLNPADKNDPTSTITVPLTFNPSDCNRSYDLSYNRSDWNKVINVTAKESELIIHAPKESIGGTVVITIVSTFNVFIKTTITVKVKKNVALVLEGTTTGPLDRVTWNRYKSYKFNDLYCYIAAYAGDIANVMESRSKDASSLAFYISNDLFRYNVEYHLIGMKGGQTYEAYFPYGNLPSNAKVDLADLRDNLNYYSDRATRDDDTGYDFFTFKVNSLKYSSEQYNIKYIVHLYKAHTHGLWNACTWLPSGYKYEKNKYWYAAVDTDEWIIKLN